MDYVGIDKAILLQGPFFGECNVFCSAKLFGATRIVLWVSPIWIRGNRTHNHSLQEICAGQEYVGVKLEFSQATGLCGIHPGSKLDDEQIEWLWEGLRIHNMVLVIDLGAVGSPSYQTSELRRLRSSFLN